MRLIAKKALRYGGQEYKVGDAFEASAKHGKILKAIRKATEEETAESAPLVRAPRNKAPAGRAGRMQFQESPTRVDPLTTESMSTESGAAGYGRRDMRAED